MNLAPGERGCRVDFQLRTRRTWTTYCMVFSAPAARPRGSFASPSTRRAASVAEAAVAVAVEAEDCSVRRCEAATTTIPCPAAPTENSDSAVWARWTSALACLVSYASTCAASYSPANQILVFHFQISSSHLSQLLLLRTKKQKESCKLTG